VMEKDLLVTLNSDDPAYFGGYVNDNYRALRQAIGLSRDETVAIARNSFVAAMMPQEEKARALAEFDRVVANL
jgi:adenine deaminase